MTKPVHWVGSSKEDLSAFPNEVKGEDRRRLVGRPARVEPVAAKPLRGFGGAGVLEIVADFDGNAFRTTYTVRFAEVIYVLHAFQKKSRRGVSTPRAELELVKKRLRRAEEAYEQWQRSQEFP